jgi:hypothetical protein
MGKSEYLENKNQIARGLGMNNVDHTTTTTTKNMRRKKHKY